MRALALAIVAASAGLAAAAPTTTETTPYPGVTHVRWTDAAAGQRAHLVLVDLTYGSLTLRGTDEADRGATTSQLAGRYGAQLAINGDLFAPPGFVPAGLAVGAAGPWASTHDDDRQAVFRFGKTVAGTDALIIVPESVVAPADLPVHVTGVVSGRPMVVRAGQAVSGFDCGDPAMIACQPAPRSALGLSADRRTLILAVVDGWQAGARGMTAAEVATLLQGYGARDAILLDGGSASTLFIAGEGGVVNAPSDGAERAVANHLSIKVGPPATRTLYGVVREGNIVTDPDLGGVLVTLDDGRTVVTATPDSRYAFDTVPIRYVCVDATKAGYDPVHQCKQMDPDNPMTFNSIAMFPAGTGPDAGVDAGTDAAPATDAGAADAGGRDGASPDASGEGGATAGCCQAGAAAPRSVATLVLFVVCALRRSRRRPR